LGITCGSREVPGRKGLGQETNDGDDDDDDDDDDNNLRPFLFYNAESSAVHAIELESFSRKCIISA
jgi:hypothetical protein